MGCQSNTAAGAVASGTIAKVELAVALALTLFAVLLHITFFHHAGALWRDEISSVNLVNLGSLAEVVQQNHLDSFPVAWPVLLWTWVGVGLGENDLALRGLGLCIGLGVLGALWCCARRFDVRAPMLSLLLFALNPTLFVYGDSLRGYGLGTMMLLFALAAMWGLVEASTTRSIVCAGLIAIVAVQCMFPNAGMLLAISIGASVVCFRRGDMRAALAVLCIGICALVSLLPYLNTIAKHRAWTALVQVPLDLARMGTKFAEALGSARPSMIWIAGILFVFGVCVCFSRRWRDTRAVKDGVLLYLGAAAVAALVLHAVYLLTLSVTTHPWYFLAPMGVVAVAIDAAVFAFVSDNRAARWVRVAGVVCVAAWVAPNLWSKAHTRMTNLDDVARELERGAAKDDLVVLTSWYAGVTVERYYRGAAPWVSVPDFEERHFQPYAAFKDKLSEPEPMKPVLDRISDTLRTGHNVWIVGGLPLLRPEEAPGELPPPPHPAVGWNESSYTRVWLRQVSRLLLSKAKGVQQVPLPTRAVVSEFESLPLTRIWGWR